MAALPNLGQTVQEALSDSKIDQAKLQGKNIALTVGSRGIANLPLLVRAVGEWLKASGARPFIVPSMGSHGGATPAGQQKVLAEYGITEKEVGIPIRSQINAVHLGNTPEGFDVFMDQLAYESDGVVVFNRIKPHTDFSGRTESGWLKMLAIGLGKVQGARTCHRYCRQYGYEKSIRAIGSYSVASGKILCALGVIENEEHKICAVRSALPNNLIKREEEALVLARKLLPRLPFRDIDLLIVDQLGKNISGTGFDTKVIGRGVPLKPNEAPKIKLIYLRDITPESEGNALGIGMADFIHERCFHKVDLRKTYINTQAALNPPMAALPMHFPSDGEAIRFAVNVLGGNNKSRNRVVWIKNTLLLSEIFASESLLSNDSFPGGYSRVQSTITQPFDTDDNLIPVWERR